VFATEVDVRIRKLPVSTRLVLVGTGPVSGYLVSAPVQSGLLRRRRGLSYLSRSNWRRLFDVTEIFPKYYPRIDDTPGKEGNPNDGDGNSLIA
jgi:hypothetical protein